MHSVHTYQILNHYTSRQELDPGFEVLDNSANERPDWYEYWPIRKFLLAGPLEENAFYGFLSPKFKLKTNLDAAAVREFIADSDAATDVVLFSPSIHNSAFYLNVFEHGNAEHPGLMQVANDFFARINRLQPLEDLVSDSRNTVHSNYFIAKPRFWRAWLQITEQLFAIAEMPQDPLGHPIAHAHAVPRQPRCADEDISHGTSGNLDPHHRQEFQRACSRSFCRAIPHLQIAGRDHVRCPEDRLLDARTASIQGRVFDAAPLREVMEFANSHQQCLGAGRASLPANVAVLLGQKGGIDHHTTLERVLAQSPRIPDRPHRLQGRVAEYVAAGDGRRGDRLRPRPAHPTQYVRACRRQFALAYRRHSRRGRISDGGA